MLAIVLLCAFTFWEDPGDEQEEDPQPTDIC